MLAPGPLLGPLVAEFILSISRLDCGYKQKKWRFWEKYRFLHNSMGLVTLMLKCKVREGSSPGAGAQGEGWRLDGPKFSPVRSRRRRR